MMSCVSVYCVSKRLILKRLSLMTHAMLGYWYNGFCTDMDKQWRHRDTVQTQRDSGDTERQWRHRETVHYNSTED